MTLGTPCAAGGGMAAAQFDPPHHRLEADGTLGHLAALPTTPHRARARLARITGHCRRRGASPDLNFCRKNLPARVGSLASLHGLRSGRVAVAIAVGCAGRASGRLVTAQSRLLGYCRLRRLLQHGKRGEMLCVEDPLNETLVPPCLARACVEAARDEEVVHAAEHAEHQQRRKGRARACKEVEDVVCDEDGIDHLSRRVPERNDLAELSGLCRERDDALHGDDAPLRMRVD
eukprot:CAMPEP_0115858974 /NCGR_PEP_ID=MMETSP0287-20121206/16373_1 /TAXON_ID=412157 /ORGANISM="Chrysochromulina rotalis, Strain UIO044" /LENGTH=231 /DNA_ID=CAMNT_0003313253 /DNA_START=373 /DNA_END=1069 /DNA_ORIENTATION=-